MGLKGNLATVKLADVFQVLAHGNSTGLLSIRAPDGQRFVEIQNGAVSTVARSAGHALLGDLLLSRGLLDDEGLQRALAEQKRSGRLLGQIMVDLELVKKEDLESALQFQIEEEICDLFLLESGDFEFLANARLDESKALGGGFLRLRLPANTLLLEAARRQDEWREITKRIPSQAMLFCLKPEAEELLEEGGGLSPEGQILVTLVRNGRTIEAMVQKACLGRLTTNQLLLELWDAGLLAPRPLDEYAATAAEHLKNGRIEEAERIAEEAKRRGKLTGAPKEALEKVLSEISRRRAAARGVPSDSGTLAAENVRVRSEVIRRPHPGLILKKEKSRRPWVIAAVVILLLAGGAGWWFFFQRPKAEKRSAVWRQLDVVLQRVEQLMAEKKYAAALEEWKQFSSFESVVMEKRNEKLDALRDQLQYMAANAVEKATKAVSEAEKSGPAEKKEKLNALSKVVGELVAYEKVERADLTPDIADAVRDCLDQCEGTLHCLRAAEYRRRLDAVEAEQKTVGAEKTAAALRELLKEHPPEKTAVVARDLLYGIETAARKARHLLATGIRLAAAGGEQAAETVFKRLKKEYPEYQVAAAADTELQRLRQTAAEQEEKLGVIQQLVLRKQRAEAIAGLKKFLDSHPFEKTGERARRLLQGLLPKEAREADRLSQDVESAVLLEDFAKAARFGLELATKYPYSEAAARLLLPVRITSVPSGAMVEVDGAPQGLTPRVVRLPIGRVFLLSLKRDGCFPYANVCKNFRQAKLDIELFPAPEWTRRLPFPAVAGMAIKGARLAVAAGGRLLLGDLSRCASVVAVYRAAVGSGAVPGVGKTVGAALLPPVFSTAADGGAKWLFYRRSGRSFSRRPAAAAGLALKKPLTATAPLAAGPVLFRETENAGGRLLLAAATTKGLEVFAAEGEGSKALWKVGLGEEKPEVPEATKEKATANKKETKGQESEKTKTVVPAGLAFAGGVFYVAHTDGRFYAVRAAKGTVLWSVLMPKNTWGTPAAVGGEHGAAALAGKDGLTVFDPADGKVLHTVKTDAACLFGPVAFGEYFLLCTRDERLLCVRADRASPTWKKTIPGRVLLPPVVAEGQKRLLAVVSGKNELLLLDGKGRRLWSSPLPARPVALAFGKDRLYVSMDNADLAAFKLVR